MKVLLVEGITDVNFVRYIYSKIDEAFDFNDFKASRQASTAKVVTFENIKHDFQIINLKGQDNLLYVLEEILKPNIINITQIGIILDADHDFVLSKEILDNLIKKSGIEKDKFLPFLTPNNSDTGNLETLLLSSLDRKRIPQLQCFKEYKMCLMETIADIEKRAIDKHEVEAYIKFSEKPRNRNQAQFSFFDDNGDTGLWDSSANEFKPIKDFLKSIFQL